MEVFWAWRVSGALATTSRSVVMVLAWLREGNTKGPTESAATERAIKPRRVSGVGSAVSEYELSESDSGRCFGFLMVMSDHPLGYAKMRGVITPDAQRRVDWTLVLPILWY